MDEHVDVARQIEGGWVILAPPVGSGAELGRAVVGDVGDGRVAVGDPITDRAAAFVGDVLGDHTKASDGEPALGEGVRGQDVERPVPAEVPRPDGKEGG